VLQAGELGQHSHKYIILILNIGFKSGTVHPHKDPNAVCEICYVCSAFKMLTIKQRVLLGVQTTLYILLIHVEQSQHPKTIVSSPTVLQRHTERPAARVSIRET
jgi:hypothetical protein